MGEVPEEELLSQFYQDKPKLRLPNDRKIQKIYELYRPSYRTLNFATEVERNIFAESFTNQLDPKFHNSLRYIAMKAYAEYYKGGKIDNRITLDELVLFGELCNINLPLKDVYELEVL